MVNGGRQLFCLRECMLLTESFYMEFDLRETQLKLSSYSRYYDGWIAGAGKGISVVFRFGTALLFLEMR